MPKITKIETQESAARFNIYIDYKFAVGIGEDLLVQEELKAGKELGPEQIQDLVYKSKMEKMVDAALNMLGYRPRSKQEIRNKLWKKVSRLKLQKDLRSGLIEKTLNKLEERGYLDDFDFASWWVEERIRSRPRGKLLLRSELLEKGVENKIIDRVLKMHSQEDERSWAERLLKKKSNRYKNYEAKKRKEKLVAYLQRRGFSWVIIESVMEGF